LAEDHVRFAAGMDKLVIAYPNSGVFQRFSLTSFEREVIKKVDLKRKIHCLAVGSASQGPIFLGGPQGPNDEKRVMVTFMDMDFNAQPMQLKGRHFSVPDPEAVRASANGRVFTTWGAYTVQSMVVDGLEVNFYVGNLGAGSAMPSHDGDILYSTKGMYTWQAKLIEGSQKGPCYCSVPAHGYPYHLSMANKGLTVHLAGDDRVLAALPHIDEKRENIDQWGRTNWTPDKRYQFIPDAKLIIDLPYPNDRLILHRFDMDQALAKANFDYLFVTSSPPLAVKRGDTLSYAITIKSNQAGLTYKLVNGPEGMTISPAGQISWPVPPTLEGAEVEILVAIENAAKQEIFHSFKVSLRR
jgi:hypothetical protein